METLLLDYLFFLNFSLPDILHYTIISLEKGHSKLDLFKLPHLLSRRILQP